MLLVFTKYIPAGFSTLYTNKSFSECENFTSTNVYSFKLLKNGHRYMKWRKSYGFLCWTYIGSSQTKMSSLEKRGLRNLWTTSYTSKNIRRNETWYDTFEWRGKSYQISRLRVTFDELSGSL